MYMVICIVIVYCPLYILLCLCTGYELLFSLYHVCLCVVELFKLLICLCTFLFFAFDKYVFLILIVTLNSGVLIPVFSVLLPHWPVYASRVLYITIIQQFECFTTQNMWEIHLISKINAALLNLQRQRWMIFSVVGLENDFSMMHICYMISLINVCYIKYCCSCFNYCQGGPPFPCLTVVSIWLLL